MFRLLASVALGLGLVTAATAQERVVNVYNWSDYVDPKALDEFTKQTGIKVVYDTYDNNEIVETSVMDYIAFGPTAAMNFSRFLVALRPGENMDAPGIDQVLMAVMWTKDDLDKAWKKYVVTGK